MTTDVAHVDVVIPALVPVEEAIREVKYQYVDFITADAVMLYWQEQLAMRGQLVQVPAHGLPH
jgi:hypothetical protein